MNTDQGATEQGSPVIGHPGTENVCLHCAAGYKPHDDGVHRCLGWEIPCPNARESEL